MASMTDGKRFVTTPRITSGMELMNESQGRTVVRVLIWEIEPTTATGKDQKMIRAVAAEMAMMFRAATVCQVMPKFFQMISSGTMPMTRGAICSIL